MEKIPTDALDKVVNRIIQAVHPERIRMFGFQALGQPNEESDIDIRDVLRTSRDSGYRRSREVVCRRLRGLRLSIEVVFRTHQD